MAAVEPTTFRWPLDDFDERFAEAAFEDDWESLEFEINGAPKAKFLLIFYPKGDLEENKEDCALYLYVLGFGEHPSIRVKFELCIENGKKQQLKEECFECKLLPKSSSWGCSNLCTQAELVELAQNGPLVIVCKATPLDPVDDLEWAKHTAPASVCRNIAATFDDQEFADIEVRVQDRVFRVNKLIVCSNSPVFRKMLTLQTKEKKTGVIELKKDEADTIELLLRFLYSGEVEGLAEVAYRLLPVADCYEVLALAEMCLASLVKNTTLPTVIRDLKLAFAHDHEGAFKRKLVLFARKNLEQLRHEPGWNLEFYRDNPEIAFEVTVAPSC